MCFPAMNVRCFQCHTHHTYAADLISHRKAAAPCGISKIDHFPTRMTVIEKHLGIDEKIAAQGPREEA